MAAVSNVIPFGLLFMRPLQWCLKTKGVLPEGKPALHDQGHAAMPTCLGHVEETLVLVSGPGAVWKLLPNVSAWVLRTVERGYRIQFGAPPPFNGVFPTVVSPEQGLVMEQEVETLLRKEAVEVVPLQDGESGFYSRYFIVPKKDGGLCPILDLRLLNRSVMRLKFKMLKKRKRTVNQVVSQIRSEYWFVTIDLKDAYFHVSILPQHRKFLRFAFSGEAYQYQVLPFGLVLSLGAHGGSTSRCCSRSYERAGVETERQEECAVSITENHLSRRGVGFDHDAGTFVTCSDRVNPHCSNKSERRPVTHCKAVPATAGSDGSCVQRDTFWPAVHETPTVVAQDQGVLPEGKPIPRDQGHAAMPTCLRHVEEALVPVSGPGVRSSLSPRTLATDASLIGLGAVMSGHPARGLWSSRHLTWHINCLEMLPDLIGHHVLVRTDNTAVVYYFNHQGGLRSRPLYS
ncbi:Transposon Ty3-I Gag-Pol polyprotein [Labeo rohita]|uniref:ribonuclease H n=1 Tax=Labeo rohita TaxID=84645 RepID=A0ABQ8MZE5_LABRO|nr:Transposon Ty3-I Gag-Pol polyprotein [Labeo rohita]